VALRGIDLGVWSCGLPHKLLVGKRGIDVGLPHKLLLILRYAAVNNPYIMSNARMPRAALNWSGDAAAFCAPCGVQGSGVSVPGLAFRFEGLVGWSCYRR
jgi:hypothetical protein